MKQYFIILLILALILACVVLATPWDITTATYDNNYFNMSSQDTNPKGLFFNGSGNKMYTIGDIKDRVHQYTLSTPWDITTAAYDAKNFSISSQEAASTSVFFNGSGNKMYITGTVKDLVHQYTLSTPWDITTATYDNNYFNMSSQDSSPQGVFFNGSGNKMYTIGDSNDSVHQYTLSTPWDITTAAYDEINLSVTSQDTTPTGVFFNGSGNKMYITGKDKDLVHQYTLSTPWDITTAAYDAKNFSISSQDVTPQDLFFNESGNKMYVVGSNKDSVYQYTLPSNAPTILTQIVLFNNSRGHSFNVTANASDGDGGTDILVVMLNISNGVCSQVSNQTSGNNLGVLYNCSGSSLELATLNVTFVDSGDEGVATGNNFTAYPNQKPAIKTQPVMVNDSISHAFNVSANVTDVDGYADIVNATINISSGSCVQLSNSSNGSEVFGILFNCSGGALLSTTLNITFNDNGSSVTTNSVENAYPNQAPVTSSVTINETTLYTNDAVNCSATYSDADGDAKNDEAYVWFKNGTNVSTTSSYSVFDKDDELICGMHHDDGIEWGLWVNSSSTTVLNTVPTVAVQPVLFNNSRGHSFNFTVNFTDADYDVKQLFVNISAGVCSQVGNTSNGLNSTWNCTGGSLELTTLNITLVDTSDAGIATGNNYTAFPNNAPTVQTQPVLTNASVNHSFTVYANVTDLDTYVDIINATINISDGSCVQLSNSSDGSDIFGILFNCSGGTILTNLVLNLTFNDNSTSVTTNNVENAYPNNPPTQPTIDYPVDGTAYSLNSIWVNTTGGSDVDGDTLIYYYYINNTQNSTSGGNSSFNGSDGSYSVIVGISDGYENSTNSSSVSFVKDVESPTITLSSPANMTWYGSRTVPFAYTPADNLKVFNCSLWNNMTSWSNKHHNGSTIIVNGTLNNITEVFSSDSAYLWNVQCYDLANNSGFANDNYTVVVDTTSPVVTLFSPLNYSTNTSLTINFTYNHTEANIENCSLWLNEHNWSLKKSNGSTVLTNEVISNITHAFVGDGTYLWNVRCYDKVNRSSFATDNRTIVIDFYEEAVPTGAGGAPGTAAKIVCESPKELVGGYCVQPCDGEYLVNESGIFCIGCATGFSLVNGECVPEITGDALPSSSLVSFLDELGAKIFPQSPIVGVFFVIFVGVGSYYVLNWEVKKRKKKGRKT